MDHPNASATSIHHTHGLSVSRSMRRSCHRPTKSVANQVVRCLITSLILLFVLASAACFIAWLMLHPHPPSSRVNSLAVSGFNISSPQFTPRFDIELVVTNPNKKIVFSIDQFGLLISYRGIPLLRSVVDPPNYIQILGNRSSEVKFELGMEKLSDKKKRKVLRDIKGDWSRGVVSFQVKASMRVTFRAGRWLSRQRLVEASCKDLSVEFLPAKETGKLHDGGRICSVD
ncbi:NDR1/HIN1-like protein 12 [Rhodamnia argentea]|uniref:NDR1/HIN1-like protein 12 n=1 Tax=Rhodamnia argentea TaxID=178133 RepID=A0A8B8NEA1_9MYRT|nr:NDR1/HIN1-like protein 12 [Rhodamnia argentea]